MITYETSCTANAKCDGCSWEEFIDGRNFVECVEKLLRRKWSFVTGKANHLCPTCTKGRKRDKSSRRKRNDNRV